MTYRSRSINIKIQVSVKEMMVLIISLFSSFNDRKSEGEENKHFSWTYLFIFSRSTVNGITSSSRAKSIIEALFFTLLNIFNDFIFSFNAKKEEVIVTKRKSGMKI
jgi:hypothetical protein